MGSNHGSKPIRDLAGEQLLDTEATGEFEASDTAGVWSHPTGGKPQSVTILGLGPTSQHYHAANFQYTPTVPRTQEVWTLNKGGRTQRCDLLFVMDDLIGESRKAPGYLRDLMTAGVPIITSAVDLEVADLVRVGPSPVFEYPLEAVVDYCGSLFNAARGRRRQRSDDVRRFYGLPMGRTGEADEFTDREAGLRTSYYFHNSVPYMLAYALFLETVETIHMFGCDYTYPGANIHEEDRANCEFWVGVCRANGINVKVPSDTTLLSARRQPYAYGFGARQPVLE